ncbi:MAG: hypothetical protein PHU04_02435 [Candidatus Peribacteraceae bacterium]|nr:hypothetical protein [Candidatus Peribacteraceae bacterium]
MQHLHASVPRDVSLGVLLATLLACTFAVVLPSLYAIRSMPGHYYNLLPVAQAGDTDRDGIPDHMDASYGMRMHAAPSVR